jgi:hypothetical protein
MNPSGRERKGWPSWEGPRWVGWVAVALAVGVLSIAIQELRDGDPGEAFTWTLFGAGRRRSGNLDGVARTIPTKPGGE